MTALDRYELLEAEGRYRERADAPAREVVLTFGSRALTIMATGGAGGDVALAHWPLASLQAVEDRPDGVVLAPGAASPERLEVSDAGMIAAIAEVCPDLRRRAPVPAAAGRRRWPRLLWLALPLAALVAVAPFLRGWAVGMIPEARMRAFEAAVAHEVPLLMAEAPRRCTGRDGLEALRALALRLSGAAMPPAVEVWRGAGTEVLALPGNRVLIGAEAVTGAASPEAVAAALAHAMAHIAAGAPEAALRPALGWPEIADLLLEDGPPEGARAAAALLAEPRYGPAEEAAADRAALALLAAAGLPATPYAGFATPRHPAGDRAAAARAADTVGDATFAPALSDRDWVALQGICD